MRDILILCLLPYLVYASFKKPIIGLGLWLWTSTFNLNAVLYGVADTIPYNRLFAGITILSFVFGKKNKIPFKMGALAKLVFLFFIIATLSNINAIGSVDLAWQRWTDYFKVVVFFYFAISIIEKKQHFYFLSWMFILSVGAIAATEGLKFLVTAGRHTFENLPMITGDNNFFGVMIVTLIPLSLFVLSETKNILLKKYLLGGIFLMILGVLSTYSRGAFLGLVILAFFYWKNSDKKIQWLLLFMMIGLGYGLLLPEAWLSRMDTLGSADEDSSFMARVIAWKVTFLIASDNFLGGGFRAVQNSFVWSTYSAQIHVLDFIPTPPTGGAKASHSIYFQVLGNHGFPGLIVFLSILMTAYLKLISIQKIAKDLQLENWIVNLAKMLKVSLIAYSVSGAAVNVAYFDFIYFVLAFIVALDVKVIRRHLILKRTNNYLDDGRSRNLMKSPSNTELSVDPQASY